MSEKQIDAVNWTAGIGSYVAEGLAFDKHGGIIIPPLLPLMSMSGLR